MSERLYFTQSGLIDYIMRTVTDFNRTIGTTHIATDFFCDAMNVLKFINDARQGDKFYIYIRQHGLESGSKEYCEKRCSSLGNPLIKIEIEIIPYDWETFVQYQVRLIQ